MQNIVQLLANIAQDASLQNSEALASYLETQELSAEVKAAILANDTQALARMLDVVPDIVCIILPADDEEEAEQEGSEEETTTQSVINL